MKTYTFIEQPSGRTWGVRVVKDESGETLAGFAKMLDGNEMAADLIAVGDIIQVARGGQLRVDEIVIAESE